MARLEFWRLYHRDLRQILITRNYQSIRQFYEDDRLWDEVDVWHSFVQKRVATQLKGILAKSPSAPRVLANLGSGGNDFKVQAYHHMHIDLVPRRLRNKLGIVARIEELPLTDASINVVLCVGSVINHGDAREMIAEIARVLQTKAIAVIEFDCADGLHQPRESAKKESITVNTFFNKRPLTFFEYSRFYIETQLESRKLKIEYRHSFHIISAFMLRLGLPPWFAAWFIYLDPLARLLQPLRYRGSNLLIVARKT